MKHPVNLSHELKSKILGFFFPVTMICLLLNVVSGDTQKDLIALLLYKAMSPIFNYPLYPLLPTPVPSSWVQLQRSAASWVQYFYSSLLSPPKNKNKTTSAQSNNASPPALPAICLFFNLVTPNISSSNKRQQRHEKTWFSFPKANEWMQME